MQNRQNASKLRMIYLKVTINKEEEEDSDWAENKLHAFV